MTDRVRYFRPVYIDHCQPATYRHVGTSLLPTGELRAHFADGSIVPSVYPTLDAMIVAASADYRERFREVEAL